MPNDERNDVPPWYVWALLLVLIAYSLWGCTVNEAQSAPPPKNVGLTAVATCPVGKACYTGSWSKVSDAAGAADHYQVKVTAGSFAMDTTVTTLSVPIVFDCAPGSSGTVTMDVWSVRRTKKSATSKRATASYTCADPPPPAPDTVRVTPDSVASSEPPSLGALFVEPRPESPHFDWISYTMTDFCYCWDGVAGAAARAWAALNMDLVMSGSPEAWVALNKTLVQVRYVLLFTTLDEANKDPNSLTGKFQYDMREWYKAHPEYSYEKAFLHDLNPTPTDSSSRLNPHIWSTNRFILNTLDSGARAYTVDRMRRIIAEHPASWGVFMDEMDRANMAWLPKSREGAGLDSLVWQNSIISLVRGVRDSLAPRIVQTNAAGYSRRDFETRVGIAGGYMHLELLNLSTQEQASVWDWMDQVLKTGTRLDYVGAETWTDMLNPKFLTRYPGGNYDLPVYRSQVQHLTNYYMVVPADDPHRLGLQVQNTRAPVTPDSTDLKIFRLNVGLAKGPRTVWLDTRDSLKQRARVYRRDFDNAIVLSRPITYWADTVMDARSTVTVPLPPGGPWSYVKARGQVVPMDTLRLMLSESVILVKREE